MLGHSLRLLPRSSGLSTALISKPGHSAWELGAVAGFRDVGYPTCPLGRMQQRMGGLPA